MYRDHLWKLERPQPVERVQRVVVSHRSAGGISAILQSHMPSQSLVSFEIHHEEYLQLDA